MNKLESAYQAISETVLNLNLSRDENDSVANMVIEQLINETLRVSNILEILIYNIELDRRTKSK